MTSSIAGIWPVGRTSIRGNVVRSATWPDYSATRLGGWLPSSATLGYEDRFETCVCRGRVGYSPDVCHLPNPYQQRSGLDGSIFCRKPCFHSHGHCLQFGLPLSLPQRNVEGSSSHSISCQPGNGRSCGFWIAYLGYSLILRADLPYID